MKNIFSFFVVLFCFCSFYGQTKSTGIVPLGDGSMTVKIDLFSNLNQVKITLTGPELRWFSIGFDCNMMLGEHDCLIYTDTFHDGNMSGGHIAPTIDLIENWTLQSNNVVAGIRTIEATRNYDSTDPLDYSFYSSLTSLDIIWAFASADTTVLIYHGDNFGITTLNFTDLNSISFDNSNLFTLVKSESSGKIEINNNTGNSINEIDLYDFSGKLIYKSKTQLTEKIIEFSPSNVQRGVYFVEIIFNNNLKLFKKIIL